MTSAATIVEVRDADGLRQVYDTALAPGFPPSELVTQGWLLDGVRDGEVRVLAARGDDGAVLAAAVTEVVDDGAVLLDYLVSLPASRGSGLGSRLLAQVVADAGDADLVLAEVERPDRHAGSEAYGDPTARLRFYARAGAQVLDLPYAQPPIATGEPTVPGMLLLALHVGPGLPRDAAGAVVGARVAQVIAAMLGEERDDDAALAALRSASRRPSTALLPLERWREVVASPGPALGGSIAP